MSAEEQNLTNPILIVEDNTSDETVMSFIIKKMGIRTIHCKDGFEALDMLFNSASKPKFSLIILDLQLPNTPGLTVLRRIKEDVDFKNIPIMVVSSRNGKQEVQSAVNLGVKDYLVKPLDKMLFEKKVRQLVNNTASDWAEVKFPDSEKYIGRYETPCQLISLSEVALTIKSQTPMVAQATTNFYSGVFEEIEIPHVSVRVLDCKKVENYYIIQLEFIGLSDSNLQSLRLYCRKIYAERKEQDSKTTKVLS